MAFKDELLRALCNERSELIRSIDELKEQLTFTRAKLYELEEVMTMAKKICGGEK